MFLVLVSLAVSIAAVVVSSIVAAGAKRAQANHPEAKMTAPRSGFGDPIPFIFGTDQQESPVCIFWNYHGQSSPYEGLTYRDGSSVWGNTRQPPGLSMQRNQHSATVDYVIAQRLYSGPGPRTGEELGTVTLRRIWHGQNLLWDGWGFDTPLTFTSSLLAADPYYRDNSPKQQSDGTYYNALPGGVRSASVRGDGWWYGDVQPPFDSGSGTVGGPVIGDTLVGNQFIQTNPPLPAHHTRGGGMERVIFYAGGPDERRNGEIESQIATWDNRPFVEENAQQYPDYQGLIRVVFERFYFGRSGSVPSFSFEITHTLPAPDIGDVHGIMSNGLDVNPVSVIYHMLTNPNLARREDIVSVDIPSFTAAAVRVYEEDLGVTVKMNVAEKSEDLIAELLEIIDGALYQDPATGKVILFLNREDLVSPTPPMFGDAHTIEVNSISKTTYESTFTEYRLTYPQRWQSHNGMTATSVVTERDNALALTLGSAAVVDGEASLIREASVARVIAARRLAVANTPLVKCEITLTREKSDGASALDLRPGDRFVWSYAPLGIKEIRMQVLAVNLGSLDDNGITISCIQDRFAPAPAIAEPQKPIPGNPPPSPSITISTYRIITAPYIIARMGLGADARRALSSVSIPNSGNTAGRRVGTNFDRFLILAKAPYDGASRFTVEISSADGAESEVLTNVPYTPCGTILTRLGGLLESNEGENTWFSVTGISDDVFDSIVHQPSTPAERARNLILIGEELLVIVGKTRLTQDLVQFTCERAAYDSPWNNSATPANSPVWFIGLANEESFVRRMSSPFESSGVFLIPGDWLPGNYYSPFQRPSYEPAPRSFQFALYDASGYGSPVVTNASSTLKNRANLMLPPRRIAPSGTSERDLIFRDGERTGYYYAFGSSETIRLQLAPISGLSGYLQDRGEHNRLRAFRIDGDALNQRESPLASVVWPASSVNVDPSNWGHHVHYRRSTLGGSPISFGSVPYSISSQIKDLPMRLNEASAYRLDVYVRSCIAFSQGGNTFMVQMSNPVPFSWGMTLRAEVT